MFLKAYIIFAILFGSFALFYITDHNLGKAPWYIVTIRDFIWLVFCVLALFRYFLLKKAHPTYLAQFKPYYTFLLRWFPVFAGPFLIVVIAHIYHRGLMEVAQHDLRNTFYYSLVFFILPLFVSSREDLLRLQQFLLKTCFLTFAVCLFYVFKPALLVVGRVSASFVSPNNYAFFLNLMICLSFALVLNNLAKKMHYWILILSCVVLLLTISFGNFIMFFGILLSLLLLKRRLFLSFSMIIFAVLLGYVAIEWLQLQPLIKKIEIVTTGGYTVSHRVVQYEMMWSYLLSADPLSLLFGDLSTTRFSKWDSTYFNVLRNNGLLCLAIFLCYYAFFIIHSFRLRRIAFQNGDRELGALFEGYAVFLLMAVAIPFQIYSITYRYPLNFLLFLINTLILMSLKVPSFAPSPTDQPLTK